MRDKLPAWCHALALDQSPPSAIPTMISPRLLNSKLPEQSPATGSLRGVKVSGIVEPWARPEATSVSDERLSTLQTFPMSDVINDIRNPKFPSRSAIGGGGTTATGTKGGAWIRGGIPIAQGTGSIGRAGTCGGAM
ncbi:hypothetical protein AK812_SmicGene8534 [Symbiodinium microadriaticum]|uniref:Uncharacterized protein n=1 Tax=Symbiodinium microadriaticum TaxID=2951 RepID=A0A1Q9EKP9_SYMMI|nr:hypothetical protein AK812_SmicGene8534 [Symbiodinium microadriaticum]